MIEIILTNSLFCVKKEDFHSLILIIFATSDRRENIQFLMGEGFTKLMFDVTIKDALSRMKNQESNQNHIFESSSMSLIIQSNQNQTCCVVFRVVKIAGTTHIHILILDIDC